MSDIKYQIEHEIYLNMYLEWQPGYYKSSKGLLLIEDMNDVHIQNAIISLQKIRENRARLVENIMDTDDDILDRIKNDYVEQKDLLSLKIQELQDELDFRQTTT